MLAPVVHGGSINHAQLPSASLFCLLPLISLRQVPAALRVLGSDLESEISGHPCKVRGPQELEAVSKTASGEEELSCQFGGRREGGRAQPLEE